MCVLGRPVVSGSTSLWLLRPQGFLGENTGVGCHFLLQGIFLTQGLNACLRRLLHWQMDSLPLSHLGDRKDLVI